MLVIETPNALSAVMPKRARFSKSRLVFICSNDARTKFTWSSIVDRSAPAVRVLAGFETGFLAVFAFPVAFFVVIKGMRHPVSCQLPTSNLQLPKHSRSIGSELLGSWRLGVGSYHYCVIQPSAI